MVSVVVFSGKGAFGSGTGFVVAGKTALLIGIRVHMSVMSF